MFVLLQQDYHLLFEERDTIYAAINKLGSESRNILAPLMKAINDKIIRDHIIDCTKLSIP